MRILLVTYSFPPKGGPGVQRNLKLVKYLSRLSIEPTVLTVRRLAGAIEDHTLLEEIPTRTSIIRTESLDPARIGSILGSIRARLSSKPTDVAEKKHSTREESMAYRAYQVAQRWLLVPDAAILWVPFAVSAGFLAHRKKAFDVVVGSCPGPSSLIIATILARLTRRPLVFDYRDGWLDYPYRKFATGAHRWLNERLEAIVIPQADHHVVFGSFLQDRLAERYAIPHSHFTTIPNGFDPEDFEDHNQGRSPIGACHLVHTGNLMAFRLEPFETLLKGLASLDDDTLTKITVNLVGSSHPQVRELIERYGLAERFMHSGYLSHRAALEVLCAGDVGLILLPSHDRAAVTGKIFEYLGARKPILALANKQSGCAELVAHLELPSATVEPLDHNGFAAALEAMIASGCPPIASTDTDQFDRRRQAAAFAEVLKNVLEES